MEDGQHDTGRVEERVLRLLMVSRSAEAEAAARELVRADPQSPTGHGLLAHALSKQGEDVEAVIHAREACRLDPDDTHALITLASCASSAGDHATALRAAERATELAPTSWSAHYTLATALVRGPGSSLRNVEEAIATTERLAPGSPEVHNLRGLCLLRRGDRSGARAAYERALELDPHSSVALNNLAALDIKRRPARSARLLGSAIGANPQRGLIQQNLSVVTWNMLVYLYRTLFWGWLAIALTRFLEVGVATRIALMLGLLAVALTRAGHRYRQLPRGYRSSPGLIWTSFTGKQRAAVCVMVVVLALSVVMTLGPAATMQYAYYAMLITGLAMRPLTHVERQHGSNES